MYPMVQFIYQRSPARVNVRTSFLTLTPLNSNMWTWKTNKHNLQTRAASLIVLHLLSCEDLHARQQPEQPPPAHPPRDPAVWAGGDDAAVQHGDVGPHAAGPRLWRGDGLLPRVLHPVCAGPGERPGEEHVPKKHEEVRFRLPTHLFYSFMFHLES